MLPEVIQDHNPTLLVPTVLPADRNPALTYLARLAEGSRPTQSNALETIARLLTGGALGYRELPWPAVRYQHAAAVRSALASRVAARTVNRILSALRGVAEEAWRLGLMDPDDQRRIEAVRGVRVTTPPAGRALSPTDVAALVANAGPRDAAILALAYGGGLRRAEIAGLQFADVDLTTGALTVRGKGNNTRVCYVPPAALAVLVRWSGVRLPGPGPLLAPYRDGRAHAGGITAQAVYDALRRLQRRTGVTGFSPHDCRRTFVSDLLEAGVDLVTVQRLAGHADPRVTSRYDRRGEATKQAGAARLPFPGSA